MVDLSTLKPGDIIVFRKGSKEKVTEIELNKNDPEFKYVLRTKNRLFLSYKKNGGYYSGAIGDWDIIEIIPQFTERFGMTWEELVRKAKELGFESYGSCACKIQKKMTTKQIVFWDNGTITCEDEPLFYDRTPDQMYQIILALED